MQRDKRRGERGEGAGGNPAGRIRIRFMFGGRKQGGRVGQCFCHAMTQLKQTQRPLRTRIDSLIPITFP